MSEGYKIWFLTDYEENLKSPFDSPFTLDYKTGLNVRLHPRFIIDSGELRRAEYYSSYDGTDYNDIILEVDVVWNRNEAGQLFERIETRRWYNTDDSIGDHVKVTKKYYNKEMAAKADSRRRSNIVEHMTALADTFGVLAYVQTMFRDLDDSLTSYEKTGDVRIISEIETYEGVWLEVNFPGTPYTLRQVIMSELNV